MKKLLLLLFTVPFLGFGQTKISDMPAATTPTGTELVPIVQGGANKKATINQINSGYIKTADFYTIGDGRWLKLPSAPGSGQNGQSVRWNNGSLVWEYFSPGSTYTFSNGLTESGGAVSLGGNITGNISLPSTSGYSVGIGTVITAAPVYTDAITNFAVRTKIAGSIGMSVGNQLGTNSSSAITMSNIAVTINQYDYTLTNYAGWNINNENVSMYKYSGGSRIRAFAFINGDVEFTIGSDATGDIYYKNSSGYLSRLAAGTNGHVLTLAAGIPSWAAPSGGGLTVGTSTITSGTNTKVLYNNSGVLGEYTVSGTGNVALTTSPTFTTPDIGTATGTASGDWHLTGTSTLTGAVNVVGSATNKFKFTIPSLGTSVTDEFLIENNTAATSGNQQSSGLVLGGYGWKTTSTAASQSVKFQLLNTPVQGTTNPSGLFRIKASINGAAYGTDLFSVTSLGDGALGSLTLTSNRYISFSGGVGSIYSAGLSLATNNSTTIISGGTVRMWNGLNFSATSGNQIHLGVEIPFAPTSGTATMTALNISGVINQTGGANGAIRGLYYNPTLTALGGTNRVIDATSGDINLDAGNAYIKGTGTGTGKGLTISDSGGNERFSVQHNGVINVNGSSGTAGYKLTSNGTSAPTWEAPSIKTSTTKTVAETIVRNMGTIGASSTATSAIRVNADYGNSTTLIADITVYAIKSDGSASVMGKVTGRYRKNSSGTFSVDDAGTTVTSDVTILLSIVPEINGTNPQVQVNTGASAANYDFSFTAVCSYITY